MPSSSSSPTRRATDVAPPWVRFTVVVDTTAEATALQSAWGLAVLVEDEDDTVLFDTGPSGATLLHNLGQLGFELARIDGVVLSHIHHDHVGGLQALLRTGIQPSLFVLPSFPEPFRKALPASVRQIETTPGSRVGTGLISTGEMPGPLGEQALIVPTASGIALVTGCAHPGVVRLAERARQLVRQRLRLVLGGFHLGEASSDEVDRVVRGLRTLGVEQVAPCHCTGALAVRRLRAEYGADCLEPGLGKPLVIRAEAGGASAPGKRDVHGL